jgi:hypothetical protein
MRQQKFYDLIRPLGVGAVIAEESTIIEDDTFIDSIEKSQESRKGRDTIEIIRNDMLIHPSLD